jgi:hypothetical protein
VQLAAVAAHTLVSPPANSWQQVQALVSRMHSARAVDSAQAAASSYVLTMSTRLMHGGEDNLHECADGDLGSPKAAQHV